MKGNAMEASEQLFCTQGIVYTLIFKRVKNINLRVGFDGSVRVSAPLRCPKARVEQFIIEKSAWIQKTQTKLKLRETQHLVPCTITATDAMRLFEAVSDTIYPLFESVLHGQKPVLKVRRMKTQWGSCIPAKRQITLNLLLAEKPYAAVEYVILHEYAHFVQCNHSPAFWAIVKKYMPDFKARQQLLKDA